MSKLAHCIGHVGAFGLAKAFGQNLELLKTRFNVKVSGWDTRATTADMTYVHGLLPDMKVNFSGKRIAFWVVESTEPLERMKQQVELYDEIWTASAFCKDVLESLGKPVRVVSHYLEQHEVRNLGKPSGPFTFLNIFDGHSRLTRKNPEGVIDAFVEAAVPNSRLIMKMQNVGPHVERFLKERAAGAEVTFINSEITSAALSALYQSAHCYVSLHRGEGFGYPMLEAAGAGCSVICTGFSGQRAGYTHVPFSLGPVNDETFSGEWAYIDRVEAVKAFQRAPEIFPVESLRAHTFAKDLSFWDSLLQFDEAISHII